MAVKSPVIPTDIVLTLVESVGRREDAEFYLKLFRELPKHSFAIVAPDMTVATETIGPALLSGPTSTGHRPAPGRCGRAPRRAVPRCFGR